MAFRIIRNDITKVAADAIVNTANPEPVFGGGTDAAIYKAAGEKQLLTERKKIGDIPVGEVAVTPAFRLHAKYIIHTVGPIWVDGKQGEFDELASCYRKSLLIAKQLGCGSIAFPLISTGTYSFPKDKALDIALATIRDFLNQNEMDVTLVVFDREAFVLSRPLADDVRAYIDENYVGRQEAQEYGFEGSIDSVSESRSLEDERRRRGGLQEKRRYNRRAPLSKGNEAGSPLVYGSRPGSLPAGTQGSQSLEDMINSRGDSFHEMLFRLIDQKDMKDSEVWHKANIDHKLFSKIKCNPSYTPSKKTALALAIALELNLDQTVDLLARAGLALSPSSISDLVVKYCIQHKIYDMFEVDALLFDNGQQTLGSDA